MNDFAVFDASSRGSLNYHTNLILLQLLIPTNTSRNHAACSSTSYGVKKAHVVFGLTIRYQLVYAGSNESLC